MEATEQDLLATQKALEEEVQNKVKEAVMDNFLRVRFSSRNSSESLFFFFFFFSGKTHPRREIYST